jgi:P27 family predicted phage terminase small subunit
MRGRLPIPFALNRLKGNPGQRRQAAPPEPEPLAAVPDPPDHLGAYAAAEWRRTAPMLLALGVLSALDLRILEIYCSAFERWRTAIEVTNGPYARESLTAPAVRALAKVRRESAEQMLQAAGQFGLTPLARSRLTGGLGPATRRSKFQGLIAP